MRPRRRWLTGGIFLIVLGIFIWSGATKAIVWRLISLPSSAGSSLAQSMRHGIDLIRSIKDLRAENLSLKNDRLDLQSKLTHLEDIEHENAVLKKEIGFIESQPDRDNYLPAHIIARPPSTFLQFITIDLGSNRGIAKGQAVISQGFLIGTISDITPTTATVELITASRSRIPIMLTNSRATALLQGGLAGLTGEDFPSDVTINAGESVVTSDLGGIVQSGIPVGSIEKVLPTESDLVKRATIHSPIEFGKLELVMVYKK